MLLNTKHPAWYIAGDLLLHIVFYAKIATEHNQFTLREVLDAVSEKLVARHPHIAGR